RMFYHIKGIDQGFRFQNSMHLPFRRTIIGATAGQPLYVGRRPSTRRAASRQSVPAGHHSTPGWAVSAEAKPGTTQAAASCAAAVARPRHESRPLRTVAADQDATHVDCTGDLELVGCAAPAGDVDGDDDAQRARI